jgi:hypothetical protein
MNLEKPIPTIRKAIKTLAEEHASKEFLDKPEARHYESAFDTYKVLRLLDPDRLKLSININAKEQDLKTEMGNDLYKVFQRVWVDVNKKSGKEIKQAAEQLKRTKSLSEDELNRELAELDKRFLKEKTNQVINDPRITAVFKGKEELLSRGIRIVTSSMLDLIRYNRENPSTF